MDDRRGIIRRGEGTYPRSCDDMVRQQHLTVSVLAHTWPSRSNHHAYRNKLCRADKSLIRHRRVGRHGRVASHLKAWSGRHLATPLTGGVTTWFPC